MIVTIIVLVLASIITAYYVGVEAGIKKEREKRQKKWRGEK